MNPLIKVWNLEKVNIVTSVALAVTLCLSYIFLIFTYYWELFVYYFKALVNIDGDEHEDVQTYISPPQYGVEIRDHKWDYSIILEQ